MNNNFALFLKSAETFHHDGLEVARISFQLLVLICVFYSGEGRSGEGKCKK